MSEMTAGGAPQAPAKGNVVTELVDLLVAPSRAFAALRQRNVWAHGVILALLAMVVLVALRGLVEPFLDANMAAVLRQAAAKGQPMPAGAANAMGAFAWWGFVGSTAFTIPSTALFGGAALWVAAKLFSVPLPFGRAAVIATLSTITIPVGMLLMGAQGAVLDPAAVRGLTDAALGPVRFLDPATTSPALLALVARVDLLSIWGVVLEGIGVSVIAGVARGSGTAVAAVAWLLGTILGTLPTLLV